MSRGAGTEDWALGPTRSTGNYQKKIDEALSLTGIADKLNQIKAPACGKYDSDSFNFSKKHVIVFSNYAPDMSALSADRWKIVHLVGLALSLPIVLDNTFV